MNEVHASTLIHCNRNVGPYSFHVSPEINSHDIPLQTSESRPSVINMRKNRTDQSGAAGIVATALVYTTNANPVPVKNVRR